MSFILDALKKAESERNRRVAPVLMDARIAPPRRGLPGWVWALSAVLLVNLGLLAWLLLRAPPQQAAVAVTDTTPAAPPVTADAGPVPPLPTPAAPVTPLPPPPAELPTLGAAPRVAPQVTAGAGFPPTAASDEETLPALAELLAAGVSLPELQLDLHIYDLAPASRSVLLNGQRLREGEYTPHGVKLERITAQGVVLEAGGRRFRLNAGD
jgi:general secretion pathway protein B